jgi:hypothetical protein
MRAPNDSQGSPPTLSDLLRLTRLFEQAWRQVSAGQSPPDLGAYLPPPSDPLRPTAVKELVRIDLEMRGRGNLPATLESYLQQYPELGGAAAVAVELIYQEYRVRRQYGDQPSLTRYRERFPAQYQQLLELVQEAGSLRPPPPANKSPGPNKTPMAPAGASQSEVPPARPSTAERKSPAPPSAKASNASPEVESLPVLPYVAPLPPPKDSGAPSEVETSGQDGGTFPPPPASGEKSGDILTPPTAERAGDDSDVGPDRGYRLLKVLGSGTFGKVWKAEAPGGVEVALKRLDRTLESHEAQSEERALEDVKGLRHRYLAPIHQFWVKRGRLHVVMELADGSLADRARACGPAGIPHDELLRYMHEAAEALDFLHAKGVHHRDIKPANILLLNGNVKVADFGLARSLRGEQSVVNATFCGTPAYMAPELFESKFSIHSDQWSLAVTYLELRLNRRPFKSRDWPSLMTEIRKGQLDLSPLGKAEKRVIRRALRQNPRQRYPSCTAFVEALEAAVKQDNEPPAPLPWRRWLRTAIVLLACLAAGGLLAFIIIRIVSDPHPPKVSKVGLTVLSEQLRVNIGGPPCPVRIGIHPENYKGPIRIVPDKELLPSGVTIGEVEVPDRAESVEVMVHADRTAKLGDFHVRLRTADAKLMGEAHFVLTILYLPPFHNPVGKDPKNADKVSYYKEITLRLDNNEEVQFVLIPRGQMEQPGAPDDPRTFYISRNKITRGQFGCFADAAAKDPAAEKPGNEWKKFAGDHKNMPIRGVTFRDAYLCAIWLGGRLPSLDQWDKAAGTWHSSRGHHPYWGGPYKGKWGGKPRPHVAVGLHLMQPVVIDAPEDEDDESWYGCRGMAGNCSEWTRGKDRRSVILRGWSFKKERPATFEDLTSNERSEDYDETAPDLGFRVVLEPPKD